MKILIGATLLGMLLCISGLILTWTKIPRVGYVEIQSVYQNFELKKDLERKYNQTVSERKRIADSLVITLRAMSNTLESQKVKKQSDVAQFENMRNEYLQKSKQFEEDNSALSKQYDEEIFSQLNQYVKDYGTENKYDYILGSSGDGSIMYAGEKDDLSKKVMEYINTRYSGKK